ncbi:hypothetical protein INT48_008702 [Thamnidium elegans]|uniref:Uncharacterized protein n=1 Tax=Thamnidium elegans TaxID=101142 RepID=A0A8H7SJC0_9FUNG|nr:hypothetical protein INT48_008702 [Thamnidium elegans]
MQAYFCRLTNYEIHNDVLPSPWLMFASGRQRYQTPSTYKYIKYFKEKPLSDWEEEDFIRFYDGNDVSKTKRSGLQASFSYCLNCIILQDQDVPDDIKEIVKMKRKDIRVSKTKRSENWNISSPSESSTWLINNIDICRTFYSYQNSVKEKFVEMQGYLEIENSLYDLLALSGILFLQKDNQHQGLIKNHFSTEDLKMIHKATKSEITSGKISFNQRGD